MAPCGNATADWNERLDVVVHTRHLSSILADLSIASTKAEL